MCPSHVGGQNYFGNRRQHDGPMQHLGRHSDVFSDVQRRQRVDVDGLCVLVVQVNYLGSVCTAILTFC